MKRKIEEKLKDWKQKSNGKTALLIDGARRVGKSYIVEEFARKNYKSYILIDFNAGQETYLNFIDACSILQSAFGKIKLDVVTKKGLSPYIGETILKEVEYV